MDRFEWAARPKPARSPDLSCFQTGHSVIGEGPPGTAVNGRSGPKRSSKPSSILPETAGGGNIERTGAHMRFVHRRWKLVVPAVLAPVAETAVLLWVGPSGAAAMAPQVTAPPPFDLFHDLRWISVYHNSWVLLALELVGVLCLRSLWSAWVVQRAWPDGVASPPPPMPVAFLRALVFYAVATVLLVPFVIVLFGMAVTHLSYLFFVALPPVLLIALLIHRGALSQAAGHWWRWQPNGVSLGWLAAAFVWLSALGAAISVAPWPLALVAAAGAGLLNAWVDAGLVAGIATPPRRTSRFTRKLVPVALAVTFLIVAGGVRVGFALTTDTNAPPRPPRPAAIPPPGAGGGHPVLVVAGNNSRWDTSPPIVLPAGFVAWRYSYRGLDPSRRPLPYEPVDTLQPLLRSAELLGRQVEALYRGYGKPVTLLAESEGALVARAYLLGQYPPAARMIDRAVIFDMPSGYAGVYYPRVGAQGWGVGSGWGLRGLAVVIRAMSPLAVSADAPLIRDLVDCRAMIAAVTTGPSPEGVRQVSIRALADAVDGPVPRGPFSPDTYVVTAAHGGLVGRQATRALITEILTGAPERASFARLAAARLITAVSDPWHTPYLPDRLVPAGNC
jgi:hypothetical protein